VKTQEFIRKHLAPAGAVLQKKDGTHHVYRLPSGRMLIVPVGGCHTELKPYLMSKFRRLIRGAAERPSEVVE
jgi:predicted RNA binding protein YcfA (HicA-like mRNA interferase family)